MAGSMFDTSLDGLKEFYSKDHKYDYVIAFSCEYTMYLKINVFVWFYHNISKEAIP